TSAEQNTPIASVLPKEMIESVLAEARTWAEARALKEAEPAGAPPIVTVTSYEGSKGRSAQYVSLVGVHSGELPARAEDIKDIEICRFLVGLTRTKKKCSVMTTT